MKKKTITLSRPIKRGDNDKDSIKEVTVSEPKDAGALRGLRIADLGQLDADALFVYLPRVTEPKLSQMDVESLAVSDFTKLGQEAVDFLAG